jgi:hypothetical protein
MRYRLRTLLIVLALGPPVLAGVVYAVAWLVYQWFFAPPQGIKGLS